RRFATEESAMVNCAIHSPFASHAQSPPAPDAASSHKDARRDGLTAAALQGGSRPPLSHRSAARVLAALLPLASRAQLLHSGAVDNDNSAPRLDASAATRTSARSPLRCARRPRPTARTGAEFPHSLAGLETAVGFERSQTARSDPFEQPLFWRQLGTR